MINVVVGVVTGHWSMSTHARRIGTLPTLSAEAAEVEGGGEYHSPASYMAGTLPKEKEVLEYLLHG